MKALSELNCNWRNRSFFTKKDLIGNLISLFKLLAIVLLFFYIGSLVVVSCAKAVSIEQCVHYEAGIEDLEGRVLVAFLIYNRVEHPDFPNTVEEVITEDRGPKKHDCQFSFYCDGKPIKPLKGKAFARARIAVLIAHNLKYGMKFPFRALYYHANYVSPSWAKKLKLVARSGRHIFYE